MWGRLWLEITTFSVIPAGNEKINHATYDLYFLGLIAEAFS